MAAAAAIIISIAEESEIKNENSTSLYCEVCTSKNVHRVRDKLVLIQIQIHAHYANMLEKHKK